MIGLRTMFTTLTFADTGYLFHFTMKLLNLPTDVPFMLRHIFWVDPNSRGSNRKPHTDR